MRPEDRQARLRAAHVARAQRYPLWTLYGRTAVRVAGTAVLVLAGVLVGQWSWRHVSPVVMVLAGLVLVLGAVLVLAGRRRSRSRSWPVPGDLGAEIPEEDDRW